MGIVIDSNGVIDIAASTPGKYRITYTTAGTCPNSSFQDITINALPTISIAGGNFCSGSTSTLTATASSGTAFVWELDTGSGFNVISGQTNSTISVSTVGEYRAKVTDANGCTSAYSNTLSITEFASPSVTIATVPGAVICTGDTATLTANASGGSGGFTYSWSTGDTSQAISVTTSGTYTVTVTDSNGCTAQASQAITASTAATTIASIDNDYAMSFNGTDTYVQMGENLPDLHDSARTLVFWAKATSWTASQGVVIESDAFEMTVVVGYSGQYVSFTTDVDTDNNQRKTWSASGLTDNTWHHFAMTVDSSNNISDIYVDGVAQTVSSIAGFAQSTGINNIGKRFNNSSYFNGELDEIAVFNSKLSSCDIKGIYDATTTVAGQPKSANLLDANTTIPAPVYWNRMGDS